MPNASTQTSQSETSSFIRDIRRQLKFLLHARFCRYHRFSVRCARFHCATYHNVIAHMEQCSVGIHCQYPHCASSQQAIRHWRSCMTPECPACKPIRLQHMQWQIYCLLHAGFCRIHCLPSSSPCRRRYCTTFRDVIAHMEQCFEGLNCYYPHCYTSVQAIWHWISCSDPTCFLCQPSRRRYL